MIVSYSPDPEDRNGIEARKAGQEPLVPNLELSPEAKKKEFRIAFFEVISKEAARYSALLLVAVIAWLVTIGWTMVKDIASTRGTRVVRLMTNSKLGQILVVDSLGWQKRVDPSGSITVPAGTEICCQTSAGERLWLSVKDGELCRSLRVTEDCVVEVVATPH